MTYLRYITSLLATLAALASCTNDIAAPEIPQDRGGVTITAEAVDMLPEIMMSRSEPKTGEEKKINRLHLFFFDKDGNFLEPNPQCEEKFGAYHIVDLEKSGATAVIVPKDAFVYQDNLEGIHIIAIANPICDSEDCDHTDCSFKVAGLNPDGDICHGEKYDSKAVKTISRMNDLLEWYYRPAAREDITRLPDGGMPMMAHYTAPKSDPKIFSHDGQIKLPLRSLMARVDVVVRLNPVETSEDHMFPTLKITEYGVKNMPDCVPLSEIAEGGASDVDASEIIKEKTVKVEDRDIIEGQESKLFTYYTYENVRLPKQDPEELYPEAVKNMGEDVKQRWKPAIADENASAFVMKGEYTDHQGFPYNAEFTVYLGSNVIDNFEVRRNHCYKNTLSIRGLDNISQDKTHCTFDGRVNVETFNEMYFSIINEKFLDSHWCVIPMDVYFRGDVESPECTVTIPEKCRSWVHLEHCSSEGMAPEDFKAGWGCRDYFTEDMLTNVVKETSATVTHNRDRIYFYVDENASTKPRTAKIEVKYKDRTDYVELVQAGLIPFTYGGTTYYMEAYEEYTKHYDPLDPHGTTGWYDPEGIPWAAEGSGFEFKEFSNDSKSWTQLIAGNFEWKPLDVIHSGDGLSICKYLMGIVQYSGYSVPVQEIRRIYQLNNPSTAVAAACSKNKKTTSDSQDLKWFLPSVGQAEQMITSMKGYDGEFYWTSNTARNPNKTMTSIWTGLIYAHENPERARAVKYASGNFVQSEVNSNRPADYPSSTSEDEVSKDYTKGNYNNISYKADGTGGGRTLRTQKLRVRAIRTADGVTP